MGILSRTLSSPPWPRLPRALRWAFPAVVLCGCFLLPMDGRMVVKGSIESAQGEPIADCTLSLHEATGKPRLHKTVESTFERSFTTAPATEKYFLSISCPGYPEPYRSKVFTHSGTVSEPPVDLGVVVMK